MEKNYKAKMGIECFWLHILKIGEIKCQQVNNSLKHSLYKYIRTFSLQLIRCSKPHVDGLCKRRNNLIVNTHGIKSLNSEMKNVNQWDNILCLK